MKHVAIAILTLASTLLLPTLAEARGHEPRKIFAHYMGCFPVGSGPIFYHQFRDNEFREGFRHDGSGQNVKGGRFKTWPLLPELPDSIGAEKSADLEIRRAIRSGIDGFAIDTWAGGDIAKETVTALIKAAEAGNYPFSVTICIDPWSMGGATRQEAYEEAVTWLIQNHGKSPKLARRNGKPLVFTYQGQGILAGASDAHPLSTPEGWADLINAYKKVETKVGQPIEFHLDFSELFLAGKGDVSTPDTDLLLEAAPTLCKYFGALGNFIDLNGITQNKDFMQKMSEAVRKAGAEWAPSVWYQYDNIGWNTVALDGTDKLRETWMRAIDQGASLIQFATWNDYGEHTSLAPTHATGYGIGMINRYFANWWKAGKPPAVKRDLVFVTHRGSYGETYPFQGGCWGSSLEVLTILSAPGTIKAGDQEAEVPAGLHVEKFKLHPGKVQVDLLRRGKTVVTVKGPQTVTETPLFPNQTLYCASNLDEECWQEDFPGQPYPQKDFYADDDHDGLSNAYEMYWTGRWRDFSAATNMVASADMDGDGKSNLEEFKAKTDPTRKPAEYEADFKWDTRAILERNASLNPFPDSKGTPVWTYCFKEAAVGEDIPIDGTGLQRMLYPHPNGVGFLGDGRCITQVVWSKWDPPVLQFSGQERSTDSNSRAILAWTSPINGKVKVAFKIRFVDGSNPETGIFSVNDNSGKELWSGSYKPQESGQEPVELAIQVKPGDTLYFSSWGRMRIWLEYLTITRQ